MSLNFLTAIKKWIVKTKSNMNQLLLLLHLRMFYHDKYYWKPCKIHQFYAANSINKEKKFYSKVKNSNLSNAKCNQMQSIGRMFL
jgi:hypothetical protein